MHQEHDRHPLQLGKIVAHFQSLEFAIRFFLLDAEARDRRDRGDPPLQTVSYNKLKAGDWVEEDAVTNFDTLGELIEKYNKRISSVDQSLCLDPGIVELRDALAHGRVARSGQSKHMRLLKFDRPRKAPTDRSKKQCCVTFAVEMTPTWFERQIGGTLAEIRKVVDAGRKLGINAFRDARLGE